MSYFLPAFEKAIGDRLTGDSGAGGLTYAASRLLAVHPAGSGAGVGVYNTVVPVSESGTVFPCIVYSCEIVGSDDAMRTRVRRVMVTAQVWVARTPSAAYGPLKRGSDIIERLEGDWPEKAAGTPPAYGLDRWQPDVTATGWVSDIMECVGVSPAHTEEQYSWDYRLECLVSRAAV